MSHYDLFWGKVIPFPIISVTATPLQELEENIKSQKITSYKYRCSAKSVGHATWELLSLRKPH